MAKNKMQPVHPGEILREEIEANYPSYREPPPLDDDRPNETSWVVFKRYMEEKGHSQSAEH